MKRFKRHKVKEEKSEASTSRTQHVDDYDLTYFIHDRVELMHQVFSVLKLKDVKAMAPDCVRHISIDDLQELCTEELLGISSKRLCAILDGAEPPSDTDSSSESPERLETISLDSISSDEEILSEASSRKSKKHKRHRRDSKTKAKKKKNKDTGETENPADAEKSRASRAGLTVLELLELQARARAIRAQLQQEQAAKQAASERAPSHHSSDNEVEIKEEPAEVVEISSDEDKPKQEDTREKSTPKANEFEKASDDAPDTSAVTKRINDLIITVPHTKQTRKIKLNRSKLTINDDSKDNSNVEAPKTDKDVTKTKNTTPNKNTEVDQRIKEKVAKLKEIEAKIEAKTKEKQMKVKEKKRKKKADKNKNQDSDHDEITLQLSDTEKMDLLEDLDRKNFEKLSSSDSESDSESQESDEESNESSPGETNSKNNTEDNKVSNKEITCSDKDASQEVNDKTGTDVELIVEKTNEIEIKSPEKYQDELTFIVNSKSPEKCQDEPTLIVNRTIDSEQAKISNDTETNNKNNENSLKKDENNMEISSIKDIPVVEDEHNEQVIVTSSPPKETVTSQDSPKIDTNDKDSPSNADKSSAISPDETSRRDSTDKNVVRQTSPPKTVEVTLSSSLQIPVKDIPVQIVNVVSQQSTNERDSEKDLSDGEVSDRESSDIEAVELKPEVVCISDDESDKKSHKKKKKKEKKNKNKKSKKSKQNFREGGDQNFYKESQDVDKETRLDPVVNINEIEECTSLEDDVYEILELSDDSSCYEVEGTVLSKEPTAEEIEALSARIDEIEREDVVTEEEIKEHELRELENVSWKDRYLESKKVKKVLTTSNIFNALRKKNRELKKKIEESKRVEVVQEEKEVVVENIESTEEGSIGQYITLQGSTKYVDPVSETAHKLADGEEKNGEGKNGEENVGETANAEGQVAETPTVVREIRKDAKQLLKMFKRLMKYNDMNKSNPDGLKDPNKKKKKKSKKKSKDGASFNALQ